ncbi:MAG: hypothetical protein JJ878_16385, partial [Alphaproteobacteria bacterium]|nr:hypothetical protein [Alphaproteobacteria bacterium]
MSSSDPDRAALEARLGHNFANRRLLELALTHRSLAQAGKGSYERLEFLGDRVLGLLVADMLLKRISGEKRAIVSDISGTTTDS